MRISDWSSDVCSSDLNIGSGRPTDPEIAGWLDGLGGLLPDIPVAIVADRDDGPSILEALRRGVRAYIRSEEHTSELQSLMRISYAVFCLKKKIILIFHTITIYITTYVFYTEHFIITYFSSSY